MDFLETIENNPLLRFLASASAGVLGYAGLYYASKKWNVAEARHKELAFGGGVAITIIVWLLLNPGEAEAAPAEQPNEVLNIVPAPEETGNYPIAAPSYNIQAPNISLSLSEPQAAPGSCGCGCGTLSSQLSDIYTNLATQFFQSAQADEASIVAAQLAAVPDYASQYFNDQLPYEQSMSDTALFFSAQNASNTFLPGGDNPSIGAPPKYIT